MPLQTPECPDRQPDVVALRPALPLLAPLHPAVLLQTPVVLLDPPGQLPIPQPTQLVHRQVVGDPVLRVAVAGDDPERLDQAEPLQMHDGPAGRDGQLADRPVALPIQVDPPVAAHLGQEGPTAGPHCLEVLLAGIPGIENHTAGLETPGLRLPQQVPEVAVLVDSLTLSGINQAIVAGGQHVAVAPQQADQVDALDDAAVLA